MGIIKEPQSALVFAGLLISDGFDPETISERLVGCFGQIIKRSAPQHFTQTTYYNEEMGDRIMRQWLVFAEPCDPVSLADKKRVTNMIEQENLNEQGGRQVNIDPGIITMSNVILASTKNYSHRIYLGKGIYGEVTLIYKGKTFSMLDWTYPDYREPPTIEFFNQARMLLKDELNNEA